ncbi:TIGR03087 family PEP-CTERM/XrtA system glycosyltransferase [Sphingomonas donggukensis]|uniref:TIGR03087 family PEP-CTERM/XrtA system glycosyltransferase n=1 Tax=Sphingomonas donggukensis TaxID=2949093 RepID=A0ABY4TWQ2_9SPHN|nr:TIGR03087 family PEP-CTERM/XrtA system glycosyltransferase [Sphingomonas donggukensis]URW76773.1 TIGR03087 family PEP-CTERM/XrtA system glycosyltransferase [Sphingomonas donggukensis]
MGDALFLAHRTPFPPDRGDRIRAYNFLRYIGARARVHLVAFSDGDEPVDHTALDALTASHTIVPRTKSNARAAIEALATGRAVSVAAFDHPALRAAVSRVLATQPIDAIHVFSSALAQYLPTHTKARVVMDFCDVDSAKFGEYAREARGPKRWLCAREERRLLAFDRAIARRADASLFVSDAEAALFAEIGGGGRVSVIENGIDTELFDPAADFASVEADGPLIVFTGQMDYQPNVAAVTWFATDILPIVRARHPDARFAIVGRAPTPAVQALAGEHVIVTGEVAEVRGWIAAAAAVVAPLRIARGIQNKVLEAMAMARPVVASTPAAEGIDHAGTLRTGADANEIAREVIALLDDRVAGDLLGQAARAQVQRRYGWEARLQPLDALLGLQPNPVRAEPVEAHAPDTHFDTLSANGVGRRR